MQQVIIVGAGIAGLTAANYLKNNNISFTIYEASSSVGGRIKTDEQDGFLMDHGFQVLLTDYPEAKALLDYDALNLQKFEPGAVIRYKDKFTEVADPFRKPNTLLSGLFSPISGILDKFKMLSLKQKTQAKAIDKIFTEAEQPTINALNEFGFSDKMINSFFKSFLGGIFLERQLNTSSRFFGFVMKMFSNGYAAVPENGMQAIPNQLAATVGFENIKLNSSVKKINKQTVELDNGEKIKAEKIIIATQPSNVGLNNNQVKWNSTTCLYFSAPEALVKGPKLILNGNGSGLVNNVAFMDQVSKKYAPEGKSLVAVSVIGSPKIKSEKLIDEVKNELVSWFGANAKVWEHLKTYEIQQALPNATNVGDHVKIEVLDDNIITCGDYLNFGSTNAAMESGRLAAEYVAEQLAIVA